MSVSRNIHKYPSVSYKYIYIYGHLWCEEYATEDSMDSMDQSREVVSLAEWQRKHQGNKEFQKINMTWTWHEHHIPELCWLAFKYLRPMCFNCFQDLILGKIWLAGRQCVKTTDECPCHQAGRSCLPSGEQPHSNGKSPFYSWEHPRFLWPFSSSQTVSSPGRVTIINHRLSIY